MLSRTLTRKPKKKSPCNLVQALEFSLKGSTAGLSQDFSISDPFGMANMPEADDSQTDYVALMEKVPTTAGNRLH